MMGPRKQQKHRSQISHARRCVSNEGEAEADLSEDVNEENSEEDQESKRRARKKNECRAMM